MVKRRFVRPALVVAVLCVGVVVAWLCGPDGRNDRRAARPSSRWEDWLAGIDLTEQTYVPLPITYPLDETLFPPEIVAPTFRWKDQGARADTWLIRIEFADGKEPLSFRSRATRWRPGDEQWEAVKRRSLEKEAKVAVFGINRATPKKILSAGEISIGTSIDLCIANARLGTAKAWKMQEKPRTIRTLAMQGAIRTRWVHPFFIGR